MNLKFSLELRCSVLILILSTANVYSLPSSTTASRIHESETSDNASSTEASTATATAPNTEHANHDDNNDGLFGFGIRSFTVKVSTSQSTSPPINPNDDHRNVINQQMSDNERSKFKLQQQKDDANNIKLMRMFEASPSTPSSALQKITKLDDFFPWIRSKDENFRPVLMESSRKLNRTKMNDNKINNRRADMLLLPPLRFNKMDPSSSTTESVESVKIDDSARNELSSSQAVSKSSSHELIKSSSPTTTKLTTGESSVTPANVVEKADTTFKQLRDVGNIDIRIIPPEKRIDLRSRATYTNLGERSTENLDCSISNLPADATIWHPNATHVLNFPLKKLEECGDGTSKCQPESLSWEASSDIQSGDVLLVEIIDQYLIGQRATANEENNRYNSVSVYQVTRSGHENCDVTEGELLDITALNVDDKKLVTLYDKDLTDGLNLLIVVSKLWGEQCVKLKVNMKSDNCGENAECSGKGICYSDSQMDVYECHCCDGYAKYHCEEIDLCSPAACKNGGICVDINQGHDGSSYQCLCPYGYAGQRCEQELDPCKDQQCMNGATCVRSSTFIKQTNQTLQFRCECAHGFTGPLCQHNLNECEASPCVHGICVEQEDGYRCFCQPGYSGDHCELEYDECYSSPCMNDGRCIDQIGGYMCQCNAGWTGERCHIKIDFCASNPCEDGFRCIDHGDKFSCVCPGGEPSSEHNSPDCLDLPRTICEVNPCRNGATCWTSSNAAHIGSFYCACPPGFDGKLCEDKYVVDTFVEANELVLDNNVISFERFDDTLDSQSSLQTTYLVAIATVLGLGTVGAIIVAAYFYCNINNNYQKLLRRQCDLMSALKMKKKKVRESFGGRSHWLMSERHYSMKMANDNVEANSSGY